MSGERFESWADGVLRLAAAGAVEQLEQLRRSGMGTDEIVLQIEDLLIAARARNVDNPISDCQLASLEQLIQRADELEQSGSEIWGDASLRDSELWEALRCAAREALRRFEPGP